MTSDAIKPGIDSAELERFSIFHTRAVVSSEHDASRVPVELHRISFISFSCPLNGTIGEGHSR